MGILCLLELLEEPAIHFVLSSQLISELLYCLLVVRIDLIAVCLGSWLVWWLAILIGGIVANIMWLVRIW